jgi:hypothetical protein
MKYEVNHRTFHYDAEGKRIIGEPDIRLDHDIDLTLGLPWHEKGFTIEKLFDEDHYRRFCDAVHTLLISLWQRAGLSVTDQFDLARYHQVATSWEDHLRAVHLTKLLPVEAFPVPITWLENRVSDIIGQKLHVHNPFDNQRVFHFRVIRPQSSDNNPLHRDVWLEDYQDCLNLYIPIAGSNDQSALILAPGSHRWPESDIERTESGAVINGVRFNVPAVTDILRPYQLERPSPGENEFLLFSPYLIHGGAANQNTDVTRISIEIRLWKAS